MFISVPPSFKAFQSESGRIEKKVKVTSVLSNFELFGNSERL